MKFTKEELSNAVKAKMTANDKKIAISDRTLNAQVEILYALGVKDETELDDFVKQILPTIESIEGQYRHDNAAFIQKWKEEHPDKPVDKPKPTGDEDKLDQALKMISEMREEREAEKKAKLVSGKKTELLAKFKEKGISEEWSNDYLSVLSVDENTDVEAYAEKAEKLFNKSNSKTPKIITPKGGGGPGDDDDFGELVNEVKTLL